MELEWTRSWSKHETAAARLRRHSTDRRHSAPPNAYSSAHTAFSRRQLSRHLSAHCYPARSDAAGGSARPQLRAAAASTWAAWHSERLLTMHHSKALLLSRLLKNQSCREELAHFLESEFASESLEFWEAVEILRSLVHTKRSAAHSTAGVIFRKFIADGAPLQINISSELRRRTTQAYHLYMSTPGERQSHGGKARRLLGLDKRAYPSSTAELIEHAGSDGPPPELALLQESKTTPTPFDEAQLEMEKALELDSLDRFLVSAHGRYARLILEASESPKSVLLNARLVKYKPALGYWVHRYCELSLRGLHFYARQPAKRATSNVPLDCIVSISDPTQPQPAYRDDAPPTGSVTSSARSAPSEQNSGTTARIVPKDTPPTHKHTVQLRVLADRFAHRSRCRTVIVALSSSSDKHKWISLLVRAVSVARELVKNATLTATVQPTPASRFFRSAQSVLAAFQSRHLKVESSNPASKHAGYTSALCGNIPAPSHSSPLKFQVKCRRETTVPRPLPSTVTPPRSLLKHACELQQDTTRATPIPASSSYMLGNADKEADRHVDACVRHSPQMPLPAVSARTVADVIASSSTRDRCLALCKELASVLLAEWSREIVATIDLMCQPAVCAKPRRARWLPPSSYALYSGTTLEATGRLRPETPLALTVDMSLLSAPSLFWLLCAAKQRAAHSRARRFRATAVSARFEGGLSDDDDLDANFAAAVGFGAHENSATSSEESDDDDNLGIDIVARTREFAEHLDNLVDLQLRARHNWSRLRRNLKAVTQLCRDDSWNLVTATMHQILDTVYFLETSRGGVAIRSSSCSTDTSASSGSTSSTAGVNDQDRVVYDENLVSQEMDMDTPRTNRIRLREHIFRQCVSSSNLQRSAIWHDGMKKSAERLERLLHVRGCTSKCRVCGSDFSGQSSPFVVAIHPPPANWTSNSGSDDCQGKNVQCQSGSIAYWLHAKCARCEKCGVDGLRLPAPWWTLPLNATSALHRKNPDDYDELPAAGEDVDQIYQTDQFHIDDGGRVTCGRCASAVWDDDCAAGPLQDDISVSSTLFGDACSRGMALLFEPAKDATPSSF